MVKKLVTIDINDKELKVSAKPVEAKNVKEVEKTEMEKLGFVEINSSVGAKKTKKTSSKGFEKNVSETVKRTVKAQTSMVEDYFDFSFRANQNQEDKKEEKVESKKTAKKATATAKTVKAKTTTTKSTKAKVEVVKVEAELNQEQNEQIQSVKFDNDAYQIIRVARIGSLFDCDKWAIQA